MSIWPLDDGRYGLDAMFHGVSGYDRMEQHERELNHHGAPTGARRRVDDSARPAAPSMWPELSAPSSTEPPTRHGCARQRPASPSRKRVPRYVPNSALRSRRSGGQISPGASKKPRTGTRVPGHGPAADQLLPWDHDRDVLGGTRGDLLARAENPTTWWIPVLTCG